MFHLWFEALKHLFFCLGYFGNSGGFPQALPKAEEEELIQKMLTGDEAARDRLIESNLRLVAYVAKKYTKEKKDFDDLVSIGTIGLIKAVKSYNPEKKIRLATYAVRCISNEILMVMRAEKKLVNEVSLEEPIGKDSEGNEISLMDILTDEEESVFADAMKEIHQKKLYRAIRHCLTQREQEIILLRYGLLDGNPVPQREVAKKFGISRSYISRIEKRALEKLKIQLDMD